MELKDKRILVLGGAGFIGSHLVERLIQEGAIVTVFDNLKTGTVENLDNVLNHPNFNFFYGDVKDRKKVDEIVPGNEIIFHFCDDSDIQFAAKHPDTYMEQNVLGLYYVLEAMRKNGIKTILFPSSTTVFGHIENPPISEKGGPLIPLSIYGGAKLAAEGLISAWAHTFDFKAIVFRFVGIIGGKMEHGVLHDFVKKLKKDPTQLKILGDGTQMRSFVLVDECVEGMLIALEKAEKNYNIIHIGNTDEISINHTAGIVIQAMGLENVTIHRDAQRAGWKGDVVSNFIKSDTLRAWGWTTSSSIYTVHESALRLK
jgi:UDP-glucose 4-epimerase